ncbi:MAG: hypothetical protein ACLGPL_09275 [Acidobacteriota bacterium]
MIGDKQTRTFKARCPNCGWQIAGETSLRSDGVNRRGGLMLRCDNCNHRFEVEVENPEDARTRYGATIIVAPAAVS